MCCLLKEFRRTSGEKSLLRTYETKQFPAAENVVASLGALGAGKAPPLFDIECSPQP